MIVMMITMIIMIIMILIIVVIAQINNRAVWIALSKEGVRRLRI